MDIFRALVGVTFLLFLAFLFSNNRKKIDYRLVISGLLLQLTFGILITQFSYAAQFFNFFSKVFVKVLSFTNAGTEFLFGDMATDKYGFIFALQVLPTIIFFSALSSGLYYLGILQKVVKGIAWIMAKTMRLSGAESLSVAGNIFLGQTEAPLLVRPYIQKMTKSELMTLMTGGMATIAGGVLAGYVQFLGGSDVDEQNKYALYLLSASFMNAPAAIIFAKIIFPETHRDQLQSDLTLSKEFNGVNLIDALSRGASEGLKLALNVGAMLLVFIALIALVNYLLFKTGDLVGLNAVIVSSTDGRFDGLSLQYLLGNIFRIFAFAMGVDWNETLEVGSLLGQKVVINEFVAYLDLSKMKAAHILSQKSEIISAYALCGFANFSSIAIQIGGIGGMAPDRQGDISKLGFKALLAATFATMLTGTLAGVLFMK